MVIPQQVEQVLLITSNNKLHHRKLLARVLIFFFNKALCQASTISGSVTDTPSILILKA